MQSFKASVSKDLKRFNIVVKSNSQQEAKAKLHKEGYNILSLQEIGDIEVKGNKFYFDVLIDGEKKKGTIAGNDILKVYIKLVDDLKYNVLSLAYDPNDSDENKASLMNSLQDQYAIYKESKEKSKEKINENLENFKRKSKKNENNSDGFFMKKKLEEINKIITFVLVKLDNILNSELSKELDFDKKEKIEKIREVLLKIRGSTNIEKLKEIGEKALLKLGEIELQLLEKKRDDTHKKLLKDTNGLLKQIGSKKQFIEKDKDIVYIVSTNFFKLKYFIESRIREIKSGRKSIDKTGHDYLKNLSLLNKYQEKKTFHVKEMQKNWVVFVFPFGKNTEKRDNLLIKYNVLRQNIKLLDAKFKNIKFSYTKVKKGYSYLADLLIKFVTFFKEPLFIATTLYAVAFITLICLNYFGIETFSLGKDGIFYLILGQILLILLYFIRGILSFSFIFAIFTFVVIFTTINF